MRVDEKKIKKNEKKKSLVNNAHAVTIHKHQKMPATTSTVAPNSNRTSPSTTGGTSSTHQRCRTPLAEEKRSISSRRRLNAEQVIRKAQQVGGDTYFIKKSPFRKLVRHQLQNQAADKCANAMISDGALDTFRHAIERIIGSIIHDANNARSLVTHSERDTIYWTDILAILASAKTVPHSVQNWLINEQTLFNDASDKRRLTRALSSQLGRYVKNQDE